MGGAPGGAGDGADEAQLAALTARVRQDPEDLDARLELARFHLMREDLMAVFEETQEVLARDADNPAALSYQSLVRLAMGQADRAEQMLVRALEADPALFDAYVHLMLVYTSTDRMPEADAVFERAAQRFPERRAALRQILDQMKASGPTAGAPTAGAPAAGEDPHADVPPPGAAPPAAPAGPATAGAGATGGGSVAGVLELAPSVQATLAPGAAVFVTLRAPGAAGGPPLAALRLAAASFPLAFEIGQAHSMTGGQIPDRVLVEARLDTDGDLSTRPSTDPYGRADDVGLGTRNLRIALAPRTGP
jgi:cytochrome c-type biogenesis protein CcmH